MKTICYSICYPDFVVLAMTFEPELPESQSKALKTCIRVRKLALGISAHGPVTSSKIA